MLEAQRQWNDVFKMLREKYFQPKILFPSKLLISSAGRKKNFFSSLLSVKTVTFHYLFLNRPPQRA